MAIPHSFNPLGRAATQPPTLPEGYTALEYILVGTAYGTGVKVDIPFNPDYLYEFKGVNALIETYWTTSLRFQYPLSADSSLTESEYRSLCNSQKIGVGMLYPAVNNTNNIGAKGGVDADGNLRYMICPTPVDTDYDKINSKAIEAWGLCARTGAYYDLFYDGVQRRIMDDIFTTPYDDALNDLYERPSLFIYTHLTNVWGTYGVMGGGQCPVYYFRITDTITDTLICNYLPALRTADNKVVLHDTVSGTDLARNDWNLPTT